MSRQVQAATAVIDSLEFARQGGRLRGQVPVAELTRLADVLAATDGTLAWELSGERDGDGKSWLRLQVSGALELRCQRCLGPMAFAVAVGSRLLLVPPGGAWPEDELEDDAFDAIAAERELAVVPLVEEEVLLALPLAPRHEKCEPPVAVADEQEPSPFAVLAKLKQ